MNIEQLEAFRRCIALMRGTLEEVPSTKNRDIDDTIDQLESQVNEELKTRIWERYLAAEERLPGG